MPKVSDVNRKTKVSKAILLAKGLKFLKKRFTNY